MEIMLLMHVGEKIRKFRDLRGYSQANMAEELGMTQTNYSKIERGEAPNLTMKRLEDIAKVLEVDAGSILSFDEKHVLNSTSNNQGGGYSGSVVYIKESLERERGQYEARIKHLEE